MKKVKKCFALLAALAVLFSFAAVPGMASGAQDAQVLQLKKSSISHDVSNMLYGTFIEDISYACDGGLVSNLVNNNSFEYDGDNFANWSYDGVQLTLETQSPLNANNPTYVRVDVQEEGSLENLGFVEYYDYKTYDINENRAQTADMGFKENELYDFSCYIKNVDFDGQISVELDSPSNRNKSSASVAVSASDRQADWQKVELQLTSLATEDGGLSIVFEGSGTLLLDFVSLVPQSSHGYGTQAWPYTTLRSDLYEAFAALSPAFIRFPGGCFAEGDSLENLYSWKNTIGPLEERKQGYNLWRNTETGVDYINTNAMGYHEFFQLCDELNAEPIPVLNAGLICQARCGYDETYAKYQNGEITSDEWEAYLDTIALRPGTPEFENYVQDLLDLIEYANGSATSTYWGALRAANGHEEPFDLKYIGIGNENWGEVYWRNFDAIYQVIHERYPDLIIITSAGTSLEGDAYDEAWRVAPRDYPDTVVDEHYYTYDGYLFEHTDRYDDFDRNGPKVFVGEYAATPKSVGTIETKSNIFGAVEEAQYMAAGLERNSDVVAMASYGPTFAKINSQCWNVNMLWFDSQSVVYTPSYYVQMLYSNNTGTKQVDADFEIATGKAGEYVRQNVTVDEENEVLYVKLVNSTGEDQTVTVDAADFGVVNLVSDLHFGNKFKSAANELDKTYIAPSESVLEVQDGQFDVQMEGYSVHVIRIAYGANDGSGLYTLPNFVPTEVQRYTPVAVKVAVPCTAAGIVLVILALVWLPKFVKKQRAKKAQAPAENQ